MTRRTGTIHKWVSDRGFGFIKCDSGGGSLFAHVSQFPFDTPIAVGMAVEFSVGESRTGKIEAQRIRILDEYDDA